MKNLMGKTRKTEDPYMIFKAPGGWEWRVLKAYQSPEAEKANPYARWFLATKSPMTYGSWELGDGYAKDIKEHGVMTFAAPEAVDRIPPSASKLMALAERNSKPDFDPTCVFCESGEEHEH